MPQKLSAFDMIKKALLENLKHISKSHEWSQRLSELVIINRKCIRAVRCRGVLSMGVNTKKIVKKDSLLVSHLLSFGHFLPKGQRARGLKICHPYFQASPLIKGQGFENSFGKFLLVYSVLYLFWGFILYNCLFFLLILLQKCYYLSCFKNILHSNHNYISYQVTYYKTLIQIYKVKSYLVQNKKI